MWCLQNPTHSISDSVSSRSLLCHAEFSNIRVLFKSFCSSWLSTESQHGEIYLCFHSTSFYFFLLFHSSPPTLFYNWHGFISHKVPFFSTRKRNFYLYRASFALISSSAIFFPFAHLFAEALTADSYRKRENPLCSHSSIPPTLSVRAFVPRPSRCFLLWYLPGREAL